MTRSARQSPSARRTLSLLRALRAADRWTLRTFNPMPAPFGLGPRTER